MKKLFLSVALLLCVAFSNAQTFGAKVGANFANVSQKDIKDNSMKIGLHIGGFAKLGLTEKFFVQPELLYSMQGYNQKIKGYDEVAQKTQDQELTYTFHYLNIPVMAKFYVIDKLSIEAGPQFGFMVSKGAKNNTTGKTASSDDMKDMYNTFDFAVGFGLGYDVTDNIGVGVRYNLGITDIIYDNKNADYAMKNNVIMVSLAYAFGGK